MVEINPRLRLAIACPIACRPQITERLAVNVATIIPVAAGDLASGYGGGKDRQFKLVPTRLNIHAFRDALNAGCVG